MPSLLDKVVVITGASSGLGRAAALALARKGAKVVLAARRPEALEEAAAECRTLGVEAIAVPTDVTDEAAVENLATRALELTGRIDVWVNNAGVTAFGALDEGSFEPHRRVLETNVFGSMYGARAVLPIFKRQRAGILVNVSSILGKIGQPYVPSYVVSKFAVRGLTETLRTAYADEPDVHVCTLLPYAIDTPHFQSGANRIGLDPHVMPPMQSPEKVAAALVSLIERPRRELHVPRYATLGLALHQLFPATVERMVLHLVREWHFGHALQLRTRGNLFAPTEPHGEIHGERPARTRAPLMIAWGVGRLVRILAKVVAGHGVRNHSLEPHLSP